VNTFTYDSANRLIQVSGANNAALTYNPRAHGSKSGARFCAGQARIL
jgi:hypothetical protein